LRNRQRSLKLHSNDLQIKHAEIACEPALLRDGRAMKKIEAIIQPFKIDEVKQALMDVGIEGMTISEVRGHGRQKGHKEVYRGQEYNVDLLPKVKVEMVVPTERYEEIVSALSAAARTGKIGDGKIFVYDVAEAVRIRNGDRGEAAL
jgi:nitrogen regulatory protein P-II 1